MSTAQLPPMSERLDVSPDEDQPGCAVCNHPLADHDSIGLRYCQATQVHALPRNCICRGG